RSASANSIRFSLAENCRRVAISITSGSGLRASECAMLEDRRTLGTAESIEEAERLFIEDFDTCDMTGYYLYSKLLRSGVSRHIGTGGTHRILIVPEQKTHSSVPQIDLGRAQPESCGGVSAALCCEVTVLELGQCKRTFGLPRFR